MTSSVSGNAYEGNSVSKGRSQFGNVYNHGRKSSSNFRHKSEHKPCNTVINIHNYIAELPRTSTYSRAPKPLPTAPSRTVFVNNFPANLKRQHKRCHAGQDVWTSNCVADPSPAECHRIARLVWSLNATTAYHILSDATGHYPALARILKIQAGLPDVAEEKKNSILPTDMKIIGLGEMMLVGQMKSLTARAATARMMGGTALRQAMTVIVMAVRARHHFRVKKRRIIKGEGIMKSNHKAPG